MSQLMPKIIENLEDTILEAGEKIPLEEGYKALTIRKTASACGIASGTIYNYYQSKDELVAHIFLKDWFLCVRNIQEETGKICDVISGLQIIFDGIRRYSNRFRSVWQETVLQTSVTPERHDMLVSQIASLIDQLLERFSCVTLSELDRFLAEMLLYYASHEQPCFENIEPFIKKLMQ